MLCWKFCALGIVSFRRHGTIPDVRTHEICICETLNCMHCFVSIQVGNTDVNFYKMLSVWAETGRPGTQWRLIVPRFQWRDFPDLQRCVPLSRVTDHFLCSVVSSIPSFSDWKKIRNFPLLLPQCDKIENLNKFPASCARIKLSKWRGQSRWKFIDRISNSNVFAVTAKADQGEVCQYVKHKEKWIQIQNRLWRNWFGIRSETGDVHT